MRRVRYVRKKAEGRSNGEKSKKLRSGCRVRYGPKVLRNLCRLGVKAQDWEVIK